MCLMVIVHTDFAMKFINRFDKIKIRSFTYDNENLQISLCILLLFCFASLYHLIFSFSTSPFFSLPSKGDSVIFQIIGRFWAENKTPYSQLWDLKGPIIFFINYLGYVLTSDRLGVFILEIINLFIFEVICFKLFVIKYNKKFSLLLVVLVLMFMSSLWDDGGNMTEEYCLPLLMLSFYCLYKWVNKVTQTKLKKVSHKPLYSFIYGLTFSFCALTRISNCVGVCVAVLFVYVLLFINKSYTTLLKNVLFFLLGFVVITLPFCFYFFIKGAFYDFLYGTILYNIGYAVTDGLIFHIGSVKHMIDFLPGFLLIIISILFVYTKRTSLVGWFWLAVTVVTVLWLGYSRVFSHYSIIMLPYLCIALVYLKSFKIEKYHRKLKIVYTIIVLLLSFIGIYYLFSASISIYETNFNDNPKNVSKSEKISIDLVSSIPEEEKDTFVAYECEPGLYLKTNICPCYKYFTFQESEIKQNSSFYNEIYDTFNNGNAKWILLNRRNKNLAITNILNDRYSCRSVYQDSDGYFELYRLNE